jgi:serine/threonine protein kinase
MSSTLPHPASTRTAPAARSIAADSFIITLRSDSIDLTPAHSCDSSRLIAELSALNNLSKIWSVGLSRDPSIRYDNPQQPCLTSTLPHASPKWALLSSVHERQHVLAFGSVISKVLHHWHALGVVHRSLSPSSILVDVAQASLPDENSVVLLSWGACAVYHWTKESYICDNPISHPSSLHAPPERLSFSLEMFAPLTPAEDWFSLGRILASVVLPRVVGPQCPSSDSACFDLPMFDPALSVLVSSPSAAELPSVLLALLELDPVARRLNGHVVSKALKDFNRGVSPPASTVGSFYRATDIAWPIPALQIHHNGESPLSEVLLFKTHISIKSSSAFDSSAFLSLGCTVVKSLFVLWNDASRPGKSRGSENGLDIQSPSFFVVSERHTQLSLLQSIMAALDSNEAISDAARNTSQLQIDRDAVVAKLGDLFREHSQVITVLVPVFESEIEDLVEMNATILQHNICAVFVALIDADVPRSVIGGLIFATSTATIQMIDLTTPLASCSYLHDAVSRTLNIPEPLLSKVVAVLDEKAGASLGAVVSEYLLWTEQLQRNDIVRFVPQSGMVHLNMPALLSAPISSVVASSVSARLLQPGASNSSEILRLCSAASATCSDTCFYELPVELALAVADVSRSVLDEAVAMGLCVVSRSDDSRHEFLSLTHERFRNFDVSLIDVHFRFVELLYSQIHSTLQSSSKESLLTSPLRPGLVNYAVSLASVFSKMHEEEKSQLKRNVLALCEHMFALSSVGSPGSDSVPEERSSSQANPVSLSKRLPSHSQLARLLLLGVQLSNGSLEHNKARTFASAGVSLLSSLDKTVTNDVTVSMLHFQMHCETLFSFINQNVTQGTDSEKLLLKQYSEGGSSRWCSGAIFSAVLELSQSVNFMQRCHFYDAFNTGINVFTSLQTKKEPGTLLTSGNLLSTFSRCMSHQFWNEDIDCSSPLLAQSDVVFFRDAFERLILPALSCGIDASLRLLTIHTSMCLDDSEAKFPLSLTIVPVMKMLLATQSSSSVHSFSSSVLLEFVAEHLKSAVPGLQVLQTCLWTAFLTIPFSSPKIIESFVNAYSAVLHPVDNLSEMTTKPFQFPYNGSSLLAASHMLCCISSDLSDANEGDLCYTAQFYSAALAFISGCDISHLCDALSGKCASQSLSTFGERLLGALVSVVRPPLQGQASCHKDAELLPQMFYFVILSIEVLWNVVLGDWNATLSASKRASVLTMGPMLSFFELNLSFCSCLARLQKLLVVSLDDVKESLLAETVDDFEKVFLCLAPEKIYAQLQSIRVTKASAAKTNRLMSALLQESGTYLEYPGGGLLQLLCALFCEFLGGFSKEVSDCYENAYDLCLRDGLYVHSALASQLGHAYLSRSSLNRQRAVSTDAMYSEDSTSVSSLKFQEADNIRLMLDMRALRQLERAHALFSVMRFDTPSLMAQQSHPSLASAVYPDCPLSKSATHADHLWFGAFIMHDKLLRMQGCFGAQSQGSLLGMNVPSSCSPSRFSSLMELANRTQSDLFKIEAPGPFQTPVIALLHSAQIIGRVIGAQRAVVVSKTSTSVSLSATIEAAAEVCFVPLGGSGQNVVAVCKQCAVNNLPEWLLKYGFINRGIHIFQNVSTSFGSNLLSEQEDGDAALPSKNSSKLPFKKSFSRMSARGQSSRRSASTLLKPELTLQSESGLSSVVMLSWGNGATGERDQQPSYLLYFEHRRILGVFGPEFYLNTTRCSPDQFHPSAHPLAFLLGKCLSPLKSLSSVNGQLRASRSDSVSFTQKDVDEENFGNQIAERVPIVGLLWKRGSMIKNWKERHFQLFNTTFKYYTKDDKIHALKSIEITHDTTLLEVSPEDRREISAPFEHCFCLLNERLQLYLCADQSARMKKWMKVLSSTIEHARKLMHRNTESYAFNACVAPPPLNSMIIVKRLGAGGFGEVFLASWNGLLVAVKKMTKELTATTLFRFRREADIMSVMRHPNILTYMACSLDPPNLMIVMEYMSYGSLFNVLQVLRVIFEYFALQQ